MMTKMAELTDDPTSRLLHLDLGLNLAAEQFIELFGRLPQLE
jgi:hypothetical protein